MMMNLQKKSICNKSKGAYVSFDFKILIMDRLYERRQNKLAEP